MIASQGFNKRRQRRRGYALLIVMIVILTSTALAAVHQRHLGAALRVEQARLRSEDYRTGPLSVLAVAIELLETGSAPVPIDYSYNHVVGSTSTLYRVSYARVGLQWIVTAEPDPTAGSLPTLPASF